MKYWIMTIIFLASKLEKLVEGIAKEMEEYSVCLTIDTLTVCSKMLELEDKKRRLCNAKVLYNFYLSKLDEIELDIVKRHIIKGDTLEQIAYGATFNRKEVHKLYNEAMNKMISASLSLTFDEDRLLADYRDFSLFEKTLEKMKFSK